ncbi:GlsB/YeaQ/YmgE family stress response membrane protein [Opitutaceae bacterium EW11]|nr:GlsB/YeaQ/YmgE family stress response membrane protein [Opitutaceae bacterium EW11]
MYIVGMIVIGLLVGLVAKLILPGRDPGGVLVTALLGIAGSVLAHFLGTRLGWYDEQEPAGFLAAVGGAVLLLLLYRLLFRQRA